MESNQPTALEKLMDRMAFTHKISEGVTVAQSPMVGFSNPPSFSYKVIETGEKFNGYTGSAQEDYMQWKARQRMTPTLTSKPWVKFSVQHPIPPKPHQEEPTDIP